MEELKEKIELVKKYLIEEYSCEAIIIFGSYSRNTQKPESDIDIAIKSEVTIQPKKLYEIKIKLENILEKDVDLIDLDNTQDGIRYEILINGVAIYIKNELQFELYKLDMYREYLELNESRKMIIDNIKNGGSIYGK